MSGAVTVAVAQLACPADDPAERRRATVDAIADAAGQGAALVVLPELAACGYRLDAHHLAATAEAVDDPDGVVAAWRAVAGANGIAVVGGFAERTGGDGPGAGDRPPSAVANAAVAIEADGRIAGVYRKLHLFGREHDVLAPGDLGLPIVELAGLSVGMLICYDLRFVEAARVLGLRGADLIAVPTAWVPGFDKPRADGGIGQVDGVVVQANLDQVYLACADHVGAEGDLTFLGRSLVVDPYGTVVAGPLAPDRPGLAIAEVDPAVVVAARERGPGISPRGNRRTDVYGAMLGYDG